MELQIKEQALNILASAIKDRDAMQKALDSKVTVIALHNTVVGRDGLYLKKVGLDENNATTGEIEITACPLHASRFSPDDAAKIAAITTNGNGKFEAVFWRDAYAADIAKLNNLITALEERLA